MFYLKRNLPAWERSLRLAVAALLALLAYAGAFPSWPVWVPGSAAAVFGATALVGFCPACALAGRRLAKEGQ